MSDEKIVKAVQAMILNVNNLSDIRSLEKEIYFKYKQYVWSILESTGGDYTLYYYPNAVEVADVVDEDGVFLGSRFLSHSASEFGPGARETFGKLYTVLENLEFNFSSVLADIIDDPFADE